MPHHITLAFLAILMPLAAAAQDGCTAQGEAEQDRIIREFSGRPPAKGDKDAALTWSKNLNAALAAAAKRAEECTRANRPATAAAKEQECAKQASRQADELEKKYRGRTLSSQEQAARRSDEDRLLESRMSCIRSAQR